MKKRILTLMLLIITATFAAEANPVDMRTTREVAVKFVNANAKTPLCSVEELQLAKTYSISRGDAAFHVFNTPKGFVIVAADDCATPILGYSDEGQFDVNNIPIQLQDYLQGFVEQIEYGIENHIVADDNTMRKWELVRTTGWLNDNRDGEAMEPLVTALWDQVCYYNAMCPEDESGPCGHCLTGCVATAMGMIMHYWGYPTHGNRSHTTNGYPEQTVNFGETTYDWANMPDYLEETSTQAEIDAVSTLLWHCGVAVDMLYGPGSSGAYSGEVPDVLSVYFGYSDEIANQWKGDDESWLAQVKENLNLGYPLYYRGDDVNGYDSHAWVCDGYNTSDQLHFNWGWGGSGNGYFALDALNVMGYQFNDNHSAVFNIVPKCEQGTMFQVSVTSNSETMGSVSGGGVVDCSELCTLTASPEDGYQFDYWTEDGVFVSAETPYTFTVTEDRAMEAHFSVHKIEVFAAATPITGGNISGSSNTAVLSYDNGIYAAAMGTAGYNCFYWGVSFPPDKLAGMGSMSLSKVSIYDNCAYDGEVLVYRGGNSAGSSAQTGPGTLVFQQDYHCTGSNAFLEIPLAQPVPIDTTQDLWIALHNFNGHYVAAFSTNQADNAEWFGFDTGDGYVGMDYGAWMIRGYVSSDDVNANRQGDYWLGYFGVGEVCSITAVPEEGCYFTNWTENGEIVSTEETYSFAATENRSIAANFTLSVVADANPENGGEVTGGGVFNYGDNCSVSATANSQDGYQFYYWTENGETVSTDTCYTFTVTKARNLVARFGFPLTVSAGMTIEDAGVIGGMGAYDYGDTCTLTVTPSEGYVFLKWVENGVVVSTDAEYSFAVTADRDLVACLAEEGTTCNMLFYIGWGGSAYPGNYLVVTCDDNTVEYMTSPNFDLTYTRKMLTGSHITLSWISGYRPDVCMFSIMYENGVYIIQAPSDEFGIWEINDDFHFEFDVDCSWAYSDYAITAVPNIEEGGSVEGEGEYLWGTTCTLTAVPSEGYGFMYWTENGEIRSWDAVYTFMVNEARDLVAHFASEETEFCNVVFELGGDVAWMYGETLVVNYGNGIYEQITGKALYSRPIQNGNQVSLGFIPGLFSWECVLTVYYEGGTTSYQNSNLSEDFHYHFDVDCEAAAFGETHEIAVTVNPEEVGTVSGFGIYNHGSTATLTATPIEGFHFSNWTQNGEVISADAIYSFTVTEDAALEANFELNTYEIVATANPEAGGEVTGAGTYNHGETATLTATTNEGYTFINWTQGGEEVSTEATYSFTVTEAGDYVANFELNTYEITVTANPTDGGEVAGAGNYSHGETVTLTATANEGYTFVNWTLSGEEVSTEVSYSFEVTEDLAFVANFELSTITQTTNFNNGWNWWSSYIELDGNSLQNLQDGLGTSGVMIKSQNNGYASYLEGFGWYGSLTAINNESTYQVKSIAACTVEMIGNEANPGNHPITLNSGWTWVGYPMAVSMGVEEALAGIEPLSGDMLKSQNNGYASYLDGFGWYGSLSILNPGMGLMYKSNNSSPITLVYPNSGTRTDLKANQTADNNHWQPNLNAYPDNMSVMAVVELDGEELALRQAQGPDNYELAAFANGEVRGSARLLYVEPLNRYMAFLTVAGDEPAELHFGLYNTETGEVDAQCITSLQYEANAVVGSFAEPYIVRFRHNTGLDEWDNFVNLFPNPVARDQRVSLGLPAEETGEVRVEIINALGTVVETRRATSLQTITAPSMVGVYTLRISIEGKGICYRKLVVR